MFIKALQLQESIAFYYILLQQANYSEKYQMCSIKSFTWRISQIIMSHLSCIINAYVVN
jgi:hypothetical protein